MSNEKIKILVIPSGGMGLEGITTSIMNYYRHINHNEMTFTFIATTILGKENYFTSLVNEIEKNGDEVIKINRKENLLYYFIKLLKVIRKEKFDVLHVHGSSSLLAIELLAGKLGGVKIRIAHSHNTRCKHELLNRVLKPIFMRLTTVRLACGIEAGNWLYGKKDFFVINNGIEAARYKFDAKKRNNIRAKLRLNDKLVIGHVGTFNEQKNHKFLIDIFREILKIEPNSHLLLVGEGNKYLEVKERVKREGMEENITFLGVRTDVIDLLQGMDIMVLPSLYEGFPLIALEAQAAGLKIILSDNITNNVKITDLVEFESLNKSHKKWVQKILSHNIKDRNYYYKLIISSGYDVNENVKKLDNIYRNIDRVL